MYRLNLLFFFLFLTSFCAWGQINDGGSQPLSFSNGRLASTSIPMVQADPLDMRSIEAEDALKDAEGYRAPRIGVLIPVNVGLNDGVWDDLPNGDRVWRLRLTADQAKAVNLYFDDFYMPEGAKMHVYSPDQSQMIGGFGAHNNKSHNRFVTSLIYGDELVVEYFEPAAVRGMGRLHIAEINHAYRMVDEPKAEIQRDFGDSDNCQVNVNCSPEGDNKTAQRDAVARILVRVGFSSGWCTGTMVNNVRQDCTPYFLTAMHCGDSGNGSLTSQSDFDQWLFYFNYQGANCANPSQSSVPNNTITGADVRAHSNDATIGSGSDLLLLEFQSSVPSGYGVYYAGWNRSTSATTGGYGIHHPAGDIKKISTFTGTTIITGWTGSSDNAHWALQWSSTTNGHGVTEAGSSGSALFDDNGLLIGTLSGGSSFCTNTAGFDLYGRMDYHWDDNGSTSINRLRDWLDPDNTGATTMDGVYYPCVVSNDPDDAGISAISNPEDGSFFCDNPLVPEVTLKNYGTDNLTSVTINYQIDNGTINTFSWTGNLTTNGTENVTLPAISAPGGSFTFTAYTSGPNGATDPNTNNDAASVTAQYDLGVGLPYTEDFSAGIPATYFIADASNDGITWQANASVNGFANNTGVGSMFMDNYSDDTEGTLDWAFLPTLDLSGELGVSMDFDLSYAEYSSDYSDSLIIVVSTDCGASYDIIFFEGGDDLATTTDVTSVLFEPTSAGEWQTKTVDLSDYEGFSNVWIAFVNVGGYGQPIYIDNINVSSQSTVGVPNISETTELDVYPNPNNGQFVVDASFADDKAVTIQVTDVLGRTLESVQATGKDILVPLNIQKQASGVYFVTIRAEGVQITKRITVLK